MNYGVIIQNVAIKGRERMYEKNERISEGLARFSDQGAKWECNL